MNLQFPENFFDKETRCDYEVTEKTKKIWAVQLDLLNELLRICKKYDIKIGAFAGTLLGAVRHHGFIPWDDDMDVFLMPEEFKKLMAVPAEEYKYPYFMQNALTDKKFFIGYARFRNSETTGLVTYENSVDYNNGIFIDVFVLNGFVDDERKLKEQIKKMKRLKTLMMIYNYDVYKKQGLKKVVIGSAQFIVRHLFNYEMLVEEHFRIQSMYDDCSDKVTLITHNDKFKKIYWCYKDELDEFVDVPFENIVIPIPRKYDQILSHMYGNYMEFPPIESRGKWHDGVITFEPDVPYKQYIEEQMIGNDKKTN